MFLSGSPEGKGRNVDWKAVHVGEPGLELELHDPAGRLTGHVDQLVAMRDGTWELWEVKSLAPGGLKWLNGKPTPEHVIQAGAYYHGIRDALRITPDVVRLVYATRSEE